MYVQQEALEETIQRLLEFKEYGVDTETSGLMWHDRLFSIIISVAEGEVYYFNFQEYPGVKPLPRSCISELQKIFRPDGYYYVSNAKFDMRMLRQEGIIPHGNWFCTNAQGRVLKNNHISAASYSLKSSALRHGFDPKIDAVEEFIVKHKLYTIENVPGKEKTFKAKRFWEVPLEIMQEYAEHDARLHLQVGLAVKDGIEKLNNPTVGDSRQPTRIMKNEIALTGVCHEMEWAGIKVDLGYVKTAAAFETREVDIAKGKYATLTGGNEFMDSNKRLQEDFTLCGYTNIPKTEKGNPSFTDDILAELEGPLADAVRKIRHHEKRLSTYYSSFTHFADTDGVIHPNMRQGGTETGRFSYSDPNLQNIPKEETPKDGEIDPWYFPYSIVRKSFVPRDNKTFVMIDYQQQEYRMMLDYAGEKKLIAQVMGGMDVHKATAELVGIKRQQAKTLNFAILYGAGIPKIAKMLNVEEKEAQDMRMLYFSKLPNVKLFMHNVIMKGRARGYVFNWAGRRLNIANKSWAYILPNHIIQGGCADVIKFAMPLVHAILDGTKSQMILQVHDEILFEFHTDDFHLIPEVQRVMENIYPALNGMKLTTSVDHSQVSWGHCDKKEGLPK